MIPGNELFQLWHSVEVRFKDIDIGGHAHHSNVLVYFEEARARYWREIMGGGGPEDVDFILAEARVRYHARILYPLTLRVGVRVSKIGKKHLVMDYLALDSGQEPVASGETTLVMFDYEAGRAKLLPADTAAAIRAHEGAVLS
jgi:acyl-CoA thioester hydrolase